MPARLTTTAYAILGHLAMRPWTMYELAAQMRRNVHYFYPRAESQVYAEPKRLVALGLATSETIATGRRLRTRYTITPAGRAALASWMTQPTSKGPLLEFEGLLRVFLAPFGSDENLSATLDSVQTEIGGLLRLSGAIRKEYLESRAPFQHYAPTRAMIHDFLTAFATLVEAWATRSREQVRAWEGMTPAERDAAAIGSFRQNAISGPRIANPPSKASRRRAHKQPNR